MVRRVKAKFEYGLVLYENFDENDEIKIILWRFDGLPAEGEWAFVQPPADRGLHPRHPGHGVCRPGHPQHAQSESVV